MRKFFGGRSAMWTGLAMAVALMAMPVSGSSAQSFYCGADCDGPPPPPPPKSEPAPQTQSDHHVGGYYVACGFAAAAAEMIGAGIHGNDANDPRQSTLFEAGLYAAACPAFLPLTLLVAATCPDNPATYEIARLATRYGRTHQPADWTPFTNAYGLACSDGRLPPDFLAFLRANGLRPGAAYWRYLHTHHG